MTKLKLGVTVPQFTTEPGPVVDAAVRAEALGLDSVWVFDHCWPLSGGKERPALEAWTTLAYLAAATNRIGIGTLVTRSTLRQPAVLAKMAATVAEIAPGRVTVGLGSGDEQSRSENEAFGVPYFAGARRVAQMVSCAEVLHAAWHEPPVTQHDDFVAIDGLEMLPPPPVPPRLWLAGRSEGIIAAAGRLADGWNGWGGDARGLARDAERVAAAAAGRAVEITWAGLVILGADEAEARRKLGSRDPSSYIWGDPTTVAEALAARHRAGATHIVVTFPNARDPSAYALLAEAVRPQLSGAAF
ncbi:MAG: LLM class flavin-dependent oxidoreductase [Actinomycetota bacterium]|nr:LLM class flavin-dependent oxidoreductase [Actinomycetota bacterium]